MKAYHLLIVLLIGYAIGYYFRQIGNATFGKLLPAI